MATNRAKLEKEFLSADKLWKIWRIALTDLRLAEQDKNCKIDMETWFKRASPRAKRCVVCMAGSVLRRRGDIAGLSYYHPNDDEKLGPKLLAINNLRYGFIKYALEEINCGLPNEDTIDYFAMTDYDEDKKQFWKDSRQLLKHLKENNI